MQTLDRGSAPPSAAAAAAAAAAASRPRRRASLASGPPAAPAAGTLAFWLVTVAAVAAALQPSAGAGRLAAAAAGELGGRPMAAASAPAGAAAGPRLRGGHWHQQQPIAQQQPRNGSAASAPAAPEWLLAGPPYVVAHRGASGLLPEHTAEAYRLAVDQGADFIECDVAVTADLQLICRHEPDLNATTDAWEVFPDRAAARAIDGEEQRGVFACDLTLDEVLRLRARQRWPFRDHSRDGRSRVATLAEYLEVAAASPRAVGVYIETKHAAWHNGLAALVAAGTTVERLLAEQLLAAGYGAARGTDGWRRRPAFLQSFEVDSLREMSRLMPGTPTVLLVLHEDAGALTDERLSELRELGIAAVGPDKASLSRGAEAAAEGADPGAACGSGSSGGGSSSAQADATVGCTGGEAGEPRPRLESTGLVARLHAHGFEVHPYTLRDEARFVPPACEGAVACEFDFLFNHERVDGAFADYPGTLAAWLWGQQRHGGSGAAGAAREGVGGSSE